MNELLPYLVLDALVVAAFVWALKRHSLLHPLFIYLFFHAYSFTLRGWQLLFGARPLYSDSLSTLAVTVDELGRALLWADVAAVCFLIGAALFSGRIVPPTTIRVMSPKVLASIAVVGLPLGLLAFVVSRSGWDLRAQYLTAVSLWPISILSLLTLYYGFRWWLLLPLGVLLFVVGTQGYHRFMLVLPMVFLVCVGLVRSGRKWPSARLAIIALLLALVFPTLKYSGPVLARGDFDRAISLWQAGLRTPSAGGYLDTFLDQYAGALSLSDEQGHRIYGRSYLAALTLPIPRALWPEKPGLGDHVRSLATMARPYDREGRIITYLGEAYVNFGHVGFIVVPFLLGGLLGRLYGRVTSEPAQSVSLLLYVILFVAALQAFRDGLTSFVTFGIALNMPQFVAVLAARRKPLQDVPQGSVT